jgi:hypothetical protein
MKRRRGNGAGLLAVISDVPSRFPIYRYKVPCIFAIVIHNANDTSIIYLRHGEYGFKIKILGFEFGLREGRVIIAATSLLNVVIVA